MTDPVSYVPGDWVAIAGDGTWLLVDLAPSDEIVGRCWKQLSRGGEVDELLDVLVSNGIRAMPDFALVRLRGDERRGLARGAARIVLPDGAALATQDRQPWSDVAIHAGPVQLTAGEPSGPVALPLAAGVTMASSVLINSVPSDQMVVTPVSPPRPAEPSAASAPSVEHADKETESKESEPLNLAKPLTLPVLDPSSASTDAQPERPGSTYDHLFGATQRPAELRVEQQIYPESPDPVHSEPAEPLVASWGATAGWPGEPEATEAEADVAAAGPPVTPSASGLIDALPWDVAGPPPVTSVALLSLPTPPRRPLPAVLDSPPPLVDEAEPDVDIERTVNRASLRVAAAEAAPESVPSGPTVLAGHCPSGHLSAPFALTCRVCGAPMPRQDGFEVVRPALGVLRLSTGDVVVLDRGVLFGRAPDVPDGPGEQPHAVRLTSPENDISRTHAEIELDGWHVYVRDLDSTNGTVVTLPGQPPLRLRPHDPHLLERGAEVCLADEVSFVFEVTG